MSGRAIPNTPHDRLSLGIGEWVIYEACRQNKVWSEQGITDLNVAVNVSPLQFAEQHLQSSIDAALSAGMDMRYLTVEITEGMLMGDEERVIEVLHELKKVGLQLSIDDFGTGYSSLSYLKRFPVDELKIDRTFLIEVPRKKDDCAIVKAIVAMAKSLELSVVAEGVEEEDQLGFLQTIDCNVIQGFLFSKPLPVSDFEAFVRDYNKG